jgi:hypothetical protein
LKAVRGKTRAWLTSHSLDDGPSRHDALQHNRHTLQSQRAIMPHTPSSSSTAVRPSLPVLQVKPQTAKDHEERVGHRVIPRVDMDLGKIARKGAVIWDPTWPIELDMRPWHCNACRSGGGAGHRYFASTAADVEASYPGVLWHHAGKEGGMMYFTASFLHQLLLHLYDTLNFRCVRRRLIDGLLSAAMSCPNRARRVESLLQAFPSAAQLAQISRLAFSDLIRERVREHQKQLFLYSGQSLRFLAMSAITFFVFWLGI